MTDTTTATRTLVKGYRDGNGYDISPLWGIRDLSLTHGPDVATFDTEQARDLAFLSPDTLYLNLTSDERGGNWRAPLIWEAAPTPDVDWATAEEATPDRAAQATAIAAMRRREAEANERARVAEVYRDSAQEELRNLRERVQLLNDDLNEQAVEREWCSEFEEFVSRFPDLLTVNTTTVTVTLEFEVNRGTSTDHYSIADVIYDLNREPLREAISEVEVN